MLGWWKNPSETLIFDPIQLPLEVNKSFASYLKKN